MLTYWRQGRCPSYGDGVTFWALAEIIKSHAGIFETDGARNAEEKLERVTRLALADPTEAEWALRHLRPLVGLDSGSALAGDRRSEAFAAWRRLLRGPCGAASVRARRRGHPMGGRRAARFPRGARPASERRAADRPLHGTAGGVRPAADLGRRSTERHHRLAGPARRRRDVIARRRPRRPRRNRRATRARLLARAAGNPPTPRSSRGWQASWASKASSTSRIPCRGSSRRASISFRPRRRNCSRTRQFSEAVLHGCRLRARFGRGRGAAATARGARLRPARAEIVRRR